MMFERTYLGNRVHAFCDVNVGGPLNASSDMSPPDLHHEGHHEALTRCTLTKCRNCSVSQM